jgi:hypothetical protein
MLIIYSEFEILFSADIEGLYHKYLGRRVAAQPDSTERFHLAKSWFKRCTRSHGFVCALPAEVALPTRLIQIPQGDPSKLKLCITQGMRGHYVALSYSWGKGNTFKPTSHSIDRLKSRFRAVELPRTIQDAVGVAHKMGYDSIWIDQLCILQDDLDD